ncbi:MAG TPA: EAL domain-containing response regulator [Terracidiphilus sp.]|nr:EAL domain-containing response regulator [Terracidiphilus sp.]
MASADRILVIDDDDAVCGIVAALAKTMGFDCATTHDPTTFPALVTSSTSLILLDLMMPGMDGIEVLRLLGEHQIRARILLMSGMDRRVLETAEKLALSLGLNVIGHLQKPVPLDQLKTMLEALASTEQPEILIEQPPLALTDDDLRRAIARNEFVNYYQPQIRLDTGELTGFEALARWQHPELGLIPPGSFIERIEGLGLIDDLCWDTAKLALEDIKNFNIAAGFDLRISINASMHSLQNLDFPDQLVNLAAQIDVPVQSIAIEVTESGLAKQLSRTLDVLTRLRMKGFDLSIDDFGTGYAMMLQLQNVPATELKIDRSIVERIQTSESERVMAEKVIEMGHALGMEVIAEGVALREQYDLLRQMGCEGAQGFLISRPLPPAAVTRWLAEFAVRPSR